MRTTLLLLSVFYAVIATAQPEIQLKQGMKISTFVIINSKEYRLDSGYSPDSAIIFIEGNDIVVDFNNAVLRGSDDVTRPDKFQGVAIIIQNGKNIVLKNANVHGYKIAVRAMNTENLTIENCDFSYNYRKRLNSTQEREDISDWMSFHHNEKDEWLRYGAGIYLRNCDGVTVTNCTVTNGQCALMMTECDNGIITGNNFSFNSGLGIGMYRCSNNEVTGNRLDWNIRGYSHGKYNRGQDSAGILVYEQSHNNVFAYNSATHCGDGLFLWAGQTTMNTGEGGCNDNLVFGNDFSDASNNGVEATFSRNNIIHNRIERCDYGVWGGYSFNSVIGANRFSDNRYGIAIEHGQDNHILYNTFTNDQTAVKIWANPSQPADWGYTKNRDTQSRNFYIDHNLFSGNKKALDISRSRQVEIRFNQWENVEVSYSPDKQSSGINFGLNDTLDEADVAKFIRAFEVNEDLEIPEPTVYGGRQNILITEWGPYDFQRPVLWLDHTDSSRKMFFHVMGPPGKWRVEKTEGIRLSKSTGSVNDTLSGMRAKGSEVKVELSYAGNNVIDEFGREFFPEQKTPYNFGYSKFDLSLEWRISYYRMDTFYAGRYEGVFSNAVKSGPIKSDTANHLAFSWWNAPDKGVPEDHFALVAISVAVFPKGSYTFGITADDGVRFYVDGKLMLDAWDSSNYKYDDELYHEIAFELSGRHELKVEYYEHTGFAALAFDIRKAR